MNRITLDARMLEASGIGIYLQHIIPLLLLFSKNIYFNFIINRAALMPDSWQANAISSHYNCHSTIYSLSEQLELPFKMPSSDIFWSPHYNAPIFPFNAKKKLVTIHDVFHLAYFSQLTFKQKAYAKFMINAAVRLSNKIITVSEFSKQEILKHTRIKEDKIIVIHNGVNTSKYRPIRNLSLVKNVETKYRLPEKFILFVGNVKPHKNLYRLLLAFEKLLLNYADSPALVIAGQKENFITRDNNIFKLLDEKPELKENILFTGFVDNEDLPVLYNLATLFVFPSFYEGFGLPPLEAMASGCPVVVSDAASLPEVCGNGAYYVDPFDIGSIEEGMYKALTDDSLRKSLITRGIERANLFSWETSAKAHLEVLQSML